MTDQKRRDPDHRRLTDETAQHVLARAIELDHSRTSGLRVSELREVAGEAGISFEAFDAAIRELASTGEELREPRFSTRMARLGRRLRRVWLFLGFAQAFGEGKPPSVRTTSALQSAWHAIVSNAIAIPVTWVLLLVLTRFGALGPWQAMDGSVILATILGAGVARRLRARIVEVGLVGLSVMLFAEFVMHSLYGIRSVQGGPTHWAVMVAGILGVVVGIRLGAGRRPAGSVAVKPVMVVMPLASEAPGEVDPNDGSELSGLRLLTV